MAHENDANAPSRDQQPHGAALLIIDMVNCFDFAGAETLKPAAMAAARKIETLRGTMAQLGAPVIYVNDNFGEWHSERSRLVERALEQDNPVTRLLAPRENDYFVIKPQFSGFYATNLPVLLPKLGVRRLILTGIATDICVMFTAADAHMRDYALWVPQDCVAAESAERGQWALEIMANSMAAETAAADELDLEGWVAGR